MSYKKGETMKKSLGYLILLMIMILPLQAKALTGSIKISCDKENYALSETATCKVTGTSQEGVYSISANIGNMKGNFNVEFQTDRSWQGSGENGEIKLYTDEGKTGTFNIGTITVKVKEQSYSLSSLDLYLEDSQFWDTNGKAWDVDGNKVEVTFTRDSNGSTTDNKKDNTTTNNSNSTKSDNTVKKTSNSVTNPNTGDHNIFITILVLIVTLSVFGVSYKKFKKVK